MSTHIATDTHLSECNLEHHGVISEETEKKNPISKRIVKNKNKTSLVPSPAEPKAVEMGNLCSRIGTCIALGSRSTVPALSTQHHNEAGSRLGLGARERRVRGTCLSRASRALAGPAVVLGGAGVRSQLQPSRRYMPAGRPLCSPSK